MVSELPRQGEIWWTSGMDKRRPVLVVTRTAAIRVLDTILVAPITRTIRGIPTEVELGERNGLREECCASFDNLRRVRPRALTERVGWLGPDELGEICRALEAMADC